MDTLNHHSESKALQKRFSEDRDKLIEEFVRTGNPFVGYKNITSLKSKIVSPCSSDIYKVGELGNASLKNFVKGVFIDNKRSVFDPIKQNNTGFFKKTTVKDTTKVLAKNSSDILTNMFIAAPQRNTNEVPELFKWEVALPPPSLTIPTTGAVKFATKASVVESLVSFTEKHPSNNDAIFMDRGVTTVIIYASVLIRKKRPKNSHRSFEGYAMFLKDLIVDEISKFDRVDMVFDRYFESSTKSVTRTKRNGDQGTRYRVMANTPLPGNWTTYCSRCRDIFIATCNEYLLVVPNGGINVDSLQSCNQEEADTRMFLHAVHASYHRSTRVTIKSNDSDIVILGTALFPQLGLEELYVTFGRDKSYQVSQAMCTFNCFSCNTRQLFVYY